MGDLEATLHDLMAICRRSEHAFGHAAAGVHSEILRRRMAAIARQRSEFAGELAAYLHKMGAEPAAPGNRPREAGPGPKTDSAILAACETTEEDTLRHYEHALVKDLPVPLRPIVDRQRLAVQEALLDLRGFEQVRRAG
jgi:hypothetical protein